MLNVVPVHDFLTGRLDAVPCSGESMENALRACCKGIKIGKILIHREGDYGRQVRALRLPPASIV